jgi:ABC-type polysaccharide transport system permease subunit
MTVGQYGRLMKPEDAGVALSNIVVMEAYIVLIALVVAVFFAIMPKVGLDLEKQVEQDRRE